MNTQKITAIVGARPNFIKMASLIQEMRRRPRFRPTLIHTGQHYSPEMSQSFFVDLEMPQPDVNLEVGSGTHTQQTADIMRGLEPIFERDRPDLVLVVGDVNSTVATALVTSKMGIRLAHVEAGLRSFDRRMPEEINRLVTDTLSDYLFASEPSGVTNLRNEGAPAGKIFFVGNVMIDTLLRFREKARASAALERLGLEAGRYVIATLHRPSNVDDPGQLRALLAVLGEIARRNPVVFPVHPRTEQRMKQEGLSADGVILCPPQGYLDFLRLMSEARLVLTDSGGIQEETTILGVPCLTLRENTERPVTIERGTNRLVGSDPARIRQEALRILASDSAAREVSTPELWDGSTSTRIMDILEKVL
jgi:UDP-N-acetylglucosamine 2-epimerase (non-hydrolysing)